MTPRPSSLPKAEPISLARPCKPSIATPLRMYPMQPPQHPRYWSATPHTWPRLSKITTFPNGTDPWQFVCRLARGTQTKRLSHPDRSGLYQGCSLLPLELCPKRCLLVGVPLDCDLDAMVCSADFQLQAYSVEVVRFNSVAICVYLVNETCQGHGHGPAPVARVFTRGVFGSCVSAHGDRAREPFLPVVHKIQAYGVANGEPPTPRIRQ